VTVKNSNKLLIIDDDKEVRYSLKRVLSKEGYDITEADSGEAGLSAVEKEIPAVALLDNRMTGISGIETLQNLRALAPDLAIVMMTAYGTTQTAIEAMKFGAFDYLIKPFEPEKIRNVVARAFEAAIARQKAGKYQSKLKTEDYVEGIVGSSESMHRVLKQVGQVTASDATVMITGESGTGKELIARCIYQHSLRSKKPFIAVNCAAIPDNLIESELFGHEKGSFTGATGQRKGKFEICDGGTIFLDEIGDMALPTQTKILRAIQEGEIQRVGGSDPIQVNVRMIAATNKDLEDMVEKKEFREDLYYRLNVFRIRIPPLRERADDIPEIIDYHLQRLAKARKIRPKKISEEALELLSAYSWQGNVRELENVVFRSAVVAQGDTILATDLPVEITGTTDSATADARTVTERKDDAHGKLWDQFFESFADQDSGKLLEYVEKAMIERAISYYDHDMNVISKKLGITKATLKKRIQSLQ